MGANLTLQAGFVRLS